MRGDAVMGRTLAHRADALFRRGRIGRGVVSLDLVRSAPPEVSEWGDLWWPDDAVRELETELVADGLTAEARIVRMAWRHPELGRAVRHGDRAGTMAALIVGVPLVAVVGGLALLPALCAYLLARTVTFRLRLRRLSTTSDEADRSLLLAFVDVETVGTGATRVSAAGAVLIAAFGVSVASLFAAGVVQTSTRFVVGVLGCLTGALMVAAGIEGLRSARRLKRGHQFAAARAVPLRRPRVEAPVEALMWSVDVPRPRLIGPVLALAASAAAAVLFVATWSLAGVLAGVVAAAGAAVIADRGARSSLRLDTTGIVDRGVVRTRRWEWDAVYLAQNEDIDTNDNNAALVIIDSDGRKRTLVRTAGREKRQLAADYINRLARGPYPGPKAIDPVVRLTLAAVVGVLALFGLIVFAGLGLGQTKQTVDPATVPAGRPYWRSVWGDGHVGAAYVECPNTVQWLGGDHDAFCAANTRSAFLGSATALAVTVVLVIVAARLVQSVRAPVRRHAGQGGEPPIL